MAKKEKPKTQPQDTPRRKQSPDSAKNAQVRARILKAAGEQFVAQGFDEVKMGDVARRADVAKGLVFYYFNTKQDLFDAVLDQYYAAQMQALLPAISAQGTLKQRFHQGLDAYLDFVEQNPGFARLIQREVCTSPRSLDKIVQYMRPLFVWGSTLLEGSLPQDGPLGARQFFLSLFGMVINYYTYAPVLAALWGEDPYATTALKERREHLHHLLDTLLARYVPANKKEKA